MKNLLTRVPAREARRLGGHIACWNKLTAVLASDLLPLEDVRILLRLEAQGFRRPEILRRLVAYIKCRERDELLVQLGVIETPRYS